MSFLETVGFLHILLYALYGMLNIAKALIKGLKKEESDLKIYQTHI